MESQRESDPTEEERAICNCFPLQLVPGRGGGRGLGCSLKSLLFKHLKKIYFLCVCIACLYDCVPDSLASWKKALDSLKLELEMVVGHQVSARNRSWAFSKKCS